MFGIVKKMNHAARFLQLVLIGGWYWDLLTMFGQQGREEVLKALSQNPLRFWWLLNIWKTHPISTCASLWYRHLSPSWTVHTGVPQTHLNYLLLCTSPVCGLQQQHWWWQQRMGFSSQCSRSMAVQRILQGTESMELCSACGKGTCLECKLWQFTVSKLVHDFQKERSWDTWFTCSCQTGAAWRKGPEFRETKSLRAHSSHPGTLGLARPLQRLMCTLWSALSQAPPWYSGELL